MAQRKAMKATVQHQIRVDNRVIDYRVVLSKTARKLRVRVGPNGIEVVQPAARSGEEVRSFLSSNKRWLIDQIDRADRLRGLRRPNRRSAREILFRGERVRVRIETTKSKAAGNTVRLLEGEIVVSRGQGSRTPVSRSLEHWLRRQARREIDAHLDLVTARLRQQPKRVYVMDQRTKWGNCSSRRNLSFNWRIILAPNFVLRYLVTHEAAHLAAPDHSARFWLTVQSLCRDMERARQWLVRHESDLLVDLTSAVGE